MGRRSTAEREAALAEVARRYCRGETQLEIARYLEVSQQAISLDLKILEKRWQQSGLMDIDAAKGRELARIDNLERTYWQAWEDSKAERQATLAEKIDGEKPRTKTGMRRWTKDGNAAYLTGIQWCIERRCAILGLDAPVKIDITQRLRKAAEEMGVDPDEAVREAERILRVSCH